MIPRPYQIEQRDCVLGQWAAGIDKTIVVAATGTGKTILFSMVASEVVRKGGRVLILAHREELLQQAADKLERTTGLGCAVEKAELTADQTWFNVIIGSIQTLARPARREKYAPGFFDAIIVDEAHHSLAATYLETLNYFEGAKILGVTATADRGDKRSLGEFYETIAHEYGIVRAVKDGWLVRPQALTLPVAIDLSRVKVTAGDFDAKAVGHALDPYLADIADQMALHCKDRKTVAFLPLIATSQKFAAMLENRGLQVREVNGGSKDRAETLEWFRDAPKGSVLCNAMLLTEGWDEPSADCIVPLRPTKIRSLYAQMIGRGTRIFPGKKDLLILDFLWHTARHNLCRPASLICQNEDIAQRVSEIMAEATLGEESDLIDGEEAAEASATDEREEALRKMLDEQRHRKKKLVDPLQYEASIKGGAVDEYVPDMHDLRAMAPPTEKQLAALEAAGVAPSGVMCQGHASRLLDALALRRTSGLSTPKQIHRLETYGFRNVGEWTFDQAHSLITRIAGNGWKVPWGFDVYNYKPNN